MRPRWIYYSPAQVANWWSNRSRRMALYLADGALRKAFDLSETEEERERLRPLIEAVMAEIHPPRPPTNP